MRLILAALILLTPLPLSGQIPVKEREIMLMAGQTVRLDSGWADRGRTYIFDIKVATATDSAAWMELVEDSAASVKRILTPVDDAASIAITPTKSDFGIRVIGGGEMGTVYRVTIHKQTHPLSRWSGSDFIFALHQNERPAGKTITAVVVHATVSPTLESTVKWFLDPRSQVSAHYTVGKDGKTTQMVEDTGRAWHAGVSELDGIRGVNDFSVGIEIVNLNDGKDPFTDAQYEAVANIIRHLREEYHLPDSRIVSHEFIARPQGRKSDPKGFDFQRLLRMLRER